VIGFLVGRKASISVDLSECRRCFKKFGEKGRCEFRKRKVQLKKTTLMWNRWLGNIRFLAKSLQNSREGIKYSNSFVEQAESLEALRHGLCNIHKIFH
jgi:hypothetical protein